ncbi:MAG: type IV pili methyl-accepting chemotaxis transducer N-terminal domain-containing protein, partial [Pseudomonadota bacterium]
LSADISGQYANPFEITQANAMLINLAGRQRMLTQKMAKDACEIWTGYHAEQGLADLEETMIIYESSLSALLNGLPEMGIQKAPNEKIREDLVQILDRWYIIKGNLKKLLVGEELNMDQKYEIIHDFNLELDDLDHLIHDYKEYSESHH